MKRLTSIFLLYVMVLVMLFPLSVYSQVYKVPTQAERATLEPPPSFRGGGSSYTGGASVPMQRSGEAGRSLGGFDMQSAPGGMGGASMLNAGYQVHVLGEVMNPGTFTISASERVVGAIQLAGGIAGNGSERYVELRRKDGSLLHIDLLEFRLFGKLNNNPYLADNDVIFVPLRKTVIRVVGAVKRPEVYELKDEKSVSEIIELAGGLNAATSMKEPIRVIRFKDEAKEVETVPIDKDAMDNFFVLNGDVVVVPDVVTKNTEFDYNIANIPGSMLFYPSYEDRVFVLGGIAGPGAYPFSPYYTVNQYISLAGGITDLGAPRYKVVSIDGKSYKIKGSGRVNPGDTILVHRKAMTNVGWTSFVMGFASFGLSISTTILALTAR